MSPSHTAVEISLPNKPSYWSLPAPLNFEQKIFLSCQMNCSIILYGGLSFISSGIILRKKIVRGKKEEVPTPPTLLCSLLSLSDFKAE